MERLRRLLRGRFIRDRRGAATIEFALTSIIFLTLVFFVAEISRLSYLSSMLDLAISEGAKEAKNAPYTTGDDYNSRFNKRMLDEGGMIWGFLSRKDAVSVTIRYAASIDDMIAGNTSDTDYRNRPIASYKLVYRYHPFLFPIPMTWASKLLTREVIFVQEYERSKFMG
jgi:tight adherence protein E